MYTLLHHSLYLHCYNLNRYLHSFPTRRSSDLLVMGDIKVYTTTTCPYCAMVKNFLIENKIDFTEVNVEKNPQKMQELARNTGDRKSTRLNSSHVAISYAVFCLKKKKKTQITKS